MNKQIISRIFAVVLLICMMTVAVTAYAAPSATTNAGLNVSNTTLKRGDTVTVTLKVPGVAENISDCAFQVGFDKDVFEVTEVNAPLLVGADRMFSSVTDANTKGMFTCSHESENNEADVAFSGYELKATLKVKSEAVYGDYQFTIANCAVNGLDVNGAPVYLAPTMEVSSVTVKVVNPATAVSLNKTTLELKAGEKETLTATVTPDNSTDTVVWSSNNADVATVDETTGEVTAVAEGEATITATAGTKTATCKVTVTCAHANLTKTEAHTGTDCKDQGYEAYWTCDDCQQKFSDAAGADEIDAIPYNGTYGSHNLVHKPAVEGSDCQHEGTKEYWECSVCQKKFSDAAGANEINAPESDNTKGDHDLVHKPAVAGADCQHEGTKEYWECSVCQKKFSNAAGTTEINAPESDGVKGTAHAGTATKIVANNNGTHDVVYTCCDAVAQDDVACDGTATCKAKAKCSVCQAERGDLDANNHAGTETKIVANNNGTHDVVYICCDAVKENDVACDGTATCQAKAKCSVCQAEYGDKDMTKHTTEETKAVSVGNDKHNVVYKCCETVKTADVACSGGTATCQAKAVCTACGAEYGDLGAHNFETGWTKIDEDQHGHKCLTSGCTEFDGKENHAGGTATCTERATCDKCETFYGETLPHDYDETKWVNGGDGYHYHVCSCGAKEEAHKEAHKGGTATCTAQAECSECGIKYGQVLPHTDANKDYKCDVCKVTLRIDTCDHKFDENGQCKKCYVIVIDYINGKPVQKPAEESNPNTGAPVVSMTSAIVLVAAAAICLGKRK